MYVYANIDDCALIINDFLPPELFNKISTYNYKTNLSSHDQWDETLYKDKEKNITMKKVMQVNNLSKIENNKISAIDPIFEEVFKVLINCSFLPYQKNMKIVLNYYEYYKFSGINWHYDGKYTLNYSFYLHENWDHNWGGETLIDTERGLPLASYPYPNTLLVIKNNIQHKVCPVTGPIKRKVLQFRGVFYE
tara:strand:+ start:919 stop:1494 length:576 start_codon:yes stop_codon:yes gene_type:complete